MPGIVRVVAACIVVLSCLTANDAVAQFLAPTDPWQFPALTDSRPFQRGWWHFQQRAYPLDDIPAGARLSALRQIERHKATHPRATSASGTASGTWTNIGPSPIVQSRDTTGAFARNGRVDAIAVHPTDPNHWLIGAGEGGVWETRDAGVTWIPKTDDQASLAMGAIAFAPSNPNIIYAGTGDAEQAGSYAGAGLLRSIDGGLSWQLLGVATFARSSFSDIQVHPADANVVVAATTRGLWGATSRVSRVQSSASSNLRMVA